MIKQLQYVFILSLPLLCKYIFLFFFIEWDLFDSEDVWEDLVFFLGVVLLVYNNVLKKQFFLDVLSFIYVLYFILETTSYIAVSSNFSSSYMYLLLESNKQELSEFTSAYISMPIVLFVIIEVILFFIIRKIKLTVFNKKQLIIGVLGFISMIFFLKFTGLIESNAYHNIIRGAYGYIDLQNSFKLNPEIDKGDINITADNEVLVFVLGESTTRGHMQIYDYNRRTTPLLNAIKDSLFIYNNVISTDVFTLKSVPKMLTSLDIDSKKESVFNLVEVFNLAGYSTYWLSNQRPISYHDNAISKIASASSEFKFYNHIIDKHALVLDGVLLPDYKNILKRPGKKVIFIRLIGTHFDYDKRYPAAFNLFKSNSENDKKSTIINHYDNAVLYNDFIVYTFIKELQKTNNKSALLYVSDHGENLFDGNDFFGRSEEVLTKSMFEIPFVLWTSKDFMFPKDFDFQPQRKFMADHIYESIGHVFGVMHKKMERSNSVFSKSFKERKRKVTNNIDFDNSFLEN